MTTLYYAMMCLNLQHPAGTFRFWTEAFTMEHRAQPALQEGKRNQENEPSHR